MQNKDLSETAAFLAVARHRSFRRAGIERGATSSAMSHAVRNLEGRVGVRLFNRTTRSVSLTDAGEMLFARLDPAFREVREGLDSLNAYRDTPFGTVRINVPSSIAPFVLKDVMGPLLKDNPGLRLEIVATDQLVDIVSGGFDAGIRCGERLSPDMIAVRIKPDFRFAVVGSPDYFRNRPVPRTPRDLADHSCIRYAFPSGIMFDWEFARGNESIEVEVDGPLTVDSQELMIEAAVQGVGLAFVWEQRAAPFMKDSRLLRCLEDWCPADSPFFLYYPSRRHVSAAFRAMIEAIKA